MISSIVYDRSMSTEVVELDVPMNVDSISIKTISEAVKNEIELMNCQILIPYSEKSSENESNEVVYNLVSVYTDKGEPIMLPIKDNKVILKYRKVHNVALLTQPFESKQTSGTSGRGKERTIEEAIFLVHKWKKIKKLKKVSLDKAAEEIKMSKKTLGEYDRDINKGVRHNFDFGSYRTSPIGVLKKFNKMRR